MAFNRDRNHGGGGRFDNRRDGGRERPQMHPATCSNCGKSCEVPFKPTGAKPVLCNDCFRASGGPDRRDDRGGRSFDRPRFDKPRFEPRNDRSFDGAQGRPTPPHKEFEAINHKLDKILGILMATTEAPKKIKKEKTVKAAPVVEETVAVEEVTPEVSAE